jgi:2,4-dienoyl-CoA reductase-like NADH-dependent reductase (Old Yellow Enzyme family)
VFNIRQDDFGRTPEKMARFALDVVKAFAQEIGADRVGIRLSPAAYLNEIVGDLKDAEVFRYLLEQLNALKIAYVHTGNFDGIFKYKELNESTMTQFMRQHYQGNLIASGSYTLVQASKGIQEGDFNLIAIGRLFIVNPDLINRLKTRLDLKSYNANMLETRY